MLDINPYRYRGYRYDNETALYYLNSRYYNADWGRFINADAITGITGELLSHNMFAYCVNNPVNMDDQNGYLPKWVKKVAIGVAAVAIGAAVVAVTGGTAAAFLPALVTGLQSAATIGAISAGTSVAVTAVETVATGGNFNSFISKAGKAAVDGFADGFMTGRIMAGASMTYGSLLRNSGGIQIGETPNPNHGRVDIGYGNPKYNGNTILSVNNKAGSSRFRIDTDANNLLHLHYGRTSKLRSIHRTGLVKFIAGGLSGVREY